METKRCPDCKWSFKPDLAAPMQCRRNPPNVTAFMVPGRLQGQAQIMSNASFPPVDATTWCGEFVAKMPFKSEGARHVMVTNGEALR